MFTKIIIYCLPIIILDFTVYKQSVNKLLLHYLMKNAIVFNTIDLSTTQKYMTDNQKNRLPALLQFYGCRY